MSETRLALPRFLQIDTRPYKDWPLLDLAILWETTHSELGHVLTLPDGDADREFYEAHCRLTLALVAAERARRDRAQQPGRADADAQARRYGSDIIKRIKQSFDLRDTVAHDLGLSKPLDGAISSPFRADHVPSFRVYSDHFFDYGSGESGDIIQWKLLLNPGTSFAQCIEALAAEAGIDLPASSPADRPRKRRRASSSDRQVF